MTAALITGAILSKGTQVYLGEYFPSLNNEAIRRSIISVVTGGRRKRKTRTGSIVTTRKISVNLNTQERSRWKKGLTAMLGFRA
jgi:hypothetical protein